MLIVDTDARAAICNQASLVHEPRLHGPEFGFVSNGQTAGRFQYRRPDIEQYQNEKHLEIITPANDLDLSFGNDILFTPPAFTSSEHLSRCWEYFFKPRLQKIILQESFDIAAWFPGHTVRSIDGRGLKGRHYRGALFYEQYLDLLTFGGGLPHVISGKKKEIEVAIIECAGSNWPWTLVSRPELFSVHPDITFDEVSSAGAARYLQCLAEQLLTILSESTAGVEHALQLVHQSWTSVDFHYSPMALKAAVEVVQYAGRRISSDTILPLMFELEAMANMITCLSEVDVFASGIFAGNWVEVAAVPVSACRGSELCNGDRLFQELLKLSKQSFAPLVVNEHGSVCDGNHRLTAVWIWNLLNACSDCQWDLSDLHFQQRVADYLPAQETMLHGVSLFEALNHLGAFLKDPSKRLILQKELSGSVSSFDKIEVLPVVQLPEYLSSAVVKDLYDTVGKKIRIQPHICEFLTAEPKAVLPARGTYHFADCAPLPWFNVLQ